MEAFHRTFDPVLCNHHVFGDSKFWKLGIFILLALVGQTLAEVKTEYYGDAATSRVESDTSITDGTMIVHPDLPFNYESTIESWEIYADSHSGSAIRLTIWRPQASTAGNKVYRLIDASIWHNPTAGVNTYTLSGDTKISVQKGDVIGYSWRSANMLHYAPVSCTEQEKYYRYYDSHVEFQPDTDYTFSMKASNAGACRAVSLRVTVTAFVCTEVTPTSIQAGITPLGHPQQYQASTHECWILKLPSDAPAHSFIRLNFGQSNFESQTTCTKDYVTIRNGGLSTSPEILKWCNNDRPDVLDSPGSELFISFVSDAANHGTGFSLFHKMTTDASECIALTASTNNKIFNSHDTYPTSSYSSYTWSCWVITGHAGKNLLITVGDMELQSDTGCTKDYLLIRDGPYRDFTQLGRYCGSTVPAQLASTGNNVHVTFRSDGSQNFKGFKINYIVNAPTNDACTTYSIAVGAEEGTIKSANYPNSYAANTDQCWKITTTSPARIRLMIDSSSLEASADCAKDFLEVRDGPGSSSLVLRRWCGDLNMGMLTSSANNMYVRFNSDGTNQANGFQLKYIAINSMTCQSKTVTTTESTIQSSSYPSDYSINAEECWTISTLSNRIKVSVKSFDLEASTNCYNDFVELREGSSSSSPLIDRLCGSVSSMEYTTRGKNLYVYFHSNRGNNYKGFQLGLISENTVGSYGTYYAAPTAAILQSVNYPNNYPTNHVYKWLIKAKNSGDLVVLEILTMNVEESNKCEHDYLSVKDGDTSSAKELTRYCGIKSNERTTSTGSSLYVTFTSDATGVRSGFQVAIYSKTNTGEGTKKKKSKLGLYIGIGVAVLVVIIILAVLEARYCMKKKSKTKIKPANIDQNQDDNVQPPRNHARIMALVPVGSVQNSNNQPVAPPAYDDSAPPAYDDVAGDPGGQRY